MPNYFTSSMTSERSTVATMQKLQEVLWLARRPVPRPTSLFNGQLLDEKREEVYVELHQLGFIR